MINNKSVSQAAYKIDRNMSLFLDNKNKNTK